MFKKFAVAAVAVFVLGWAGTVTADPINVYDATYHSYQNTANNPCVFYGAGNCPKVAIPPTGWPDPSGPTTGTFSLLTQTYDGTTDPKNTPNTTWGEWTTVVPGGFVLGLDVNQDSGPQTLTAFTIEFWNGISWDAGYSLAATVSVPDTSNGIGWADYILAADCDNWVGTDCSAYQPFIVPDDASGIRFSFSYGMTGNDGPDKVFVVPTGAPPEPPSTVPEPASMVLLGTGLVGVATALRRRRR